MAPKSGRVGLVSTDLRGLNSSKPNRPWYAPIPDGPTPPNGSLAVENWNSRRLTIMPPDDTSLLTRSRVLFAFVNRYAARGLGREFTNSIAASRDWTVTIGRMGPKISSVI